MLICVKQILCDRGMQRDLKYQDRTLGSDISESSNHLWFAGESLRVFINSERNFDIRSFQCPILNLQESLRNVVKPKAFSLLESFPNGMLQ
jgi:hypothetical protein